MKLSERSAAVKLFAFHTASGKTKRVAVDKRDFYSLSYRHSGKISIVTDGKELISEANSITFMPKGVPYETEVIEDTQMDVIHFALADNIDFRNPTVLNVNDRGLRALFEKLIRDYHVDEPVDFKCMATFYELLARLEALDLSDSRPNIPHKIRLAREYMIQSYADPLFSVSLLAERCGVSTSYLRREFSKAYGMSPIAFLQKLRIDTAKNLLRSEYLTIGEIALQSGFSGTSYFIQVFRKAVGESPDRYRRRT